ncbi:MAG TPA: Hint domain-containing protein [Pyrinomonadaceae bacterium]
MKKAVVDRFGREVPQWTARQFKYFQKIVEKARPGVPITADLSDDGEFEFALLQHGGRAFLKRHYPTTLLMLESARVAAGAAKEKGVGPRPEQRTLLQTGAVNTWQSANAIIQASVVADGSPTCVADGISTIIDGTFLTQITMTITDLTAGMMIAQETIPNIYDRGMNVAIWAQGDLLAPGNAGLAMMTATYIQTGQTNTVVQHVPQYIAPVCPTAPPAVTNPVHKNTVSPNPIKIALNRTSTQQPDCDYYYTTTQTGGRNPDIAVQVSGSASFQNNIVSPLVFGSTLQGQLLMTRRTPPGGGFLPLPDDQFAAGVTANGTQLGWGWGASNQFGSSPWDQGQMIDLILNMQVRMANTNQPGLANVTSVQSAQASNCLTKIDPLIFVWGCLAAETLVLMADGSQKPVILVEPGEHVVCDTHGRLAVVTDKVLGWEDRADSLRILAGRHSVVVTQDHPLLTTRGPARAGDLLIGTELHTRGGVVRISDIVRFRYRNRVVNLELSPLDGATPEAAARADGTTHFANDFLVGDAVMQGALRREQGVRELDDETVLRDVPPEYHFDYVNLQRARRGEKLMVA